MIRLYLEPSNGYYSIPADGGKYYTIGTSDGKFGEFAKHKGTIFSVNSLGNVWAKEGTEKATAFIAMLLDMLSSMEQEKREHNAQFVNDDEEEWGDIEHE